MAPLSVQSAALIRFAGLAQLIHEHRTGWNPTCICAAGYMSAKSCASGKSVLDLWKYADDTNRQLYSVKRTVGTDPYIVGVRRWYRVAGCASLCVWYPILPPALFTNRASTTA